MNGTIYQRIEDNAHFRELVEKRQRFATILSIIMLAVYIGFILLIAFAPGWLGTPLNPNTSVTRDVYKRQIARCLQPERAQNR